MRFFISKYQLRKLILEKHKFHDRDITLLYILKYSCDITKMYGTMFQYILLY
jgi:hypothetical protein